jgi:hypothetical protein
VLSRFNCCCLLSPLLFLPFSPGTPAWAQAPGTALVRHAPVLDGAVEGSVQMLLGEAVALAGGASITGDLLVPGMPAVRLNGNPIYAGTLDASGALSPSNYAIVLNGRVQLRHVVRRTDPVDMPVAAAPVPPAGTRDISINSAAQTAGDFASLRNLTLSGKAGQLNVPPGAYGEFRANAGTGFLLGVPGSVEPALYHFQQLTLNAQAELHVVGPVAITVAKTLTIGGSAGAPDRPEWLQIDLAGGGATLNGGASFYGYLAAPRGAVTMNGNSRLSGGMASERLTVGGSALLRLIARTPNQPPTVALTSPPNGATFIAPARIALVAVATDPDGSVTRVEFFHDDTIAGERTVPPYAVELPAVAAGTHRFAARAHDNSGAATDSAPVTITVIGNQAPTVSLTAPAHGAIFTAPASIELVADAVDADGTVVRVEFEQDGVKIGENLVAPYTLLINALASGRYTFTARATDNLGATAVSAAVEIVVLEPNHPPNVELVAPPDGATFIAPASFLLVAAASDFDGDIARVEFFEDGNPLGERLMAPFEWNVGPLGAGDYSFTARAHDDMSGITTSAPISVLVAAPQPPSVMLESPFDGAIFVAPATVALRAIAADADGTIARVEFFEGVVKLGEVLVAPFEFVWPGVGPGSYVLTARAHDNSGLSTLSAPRGIVVRLGLPYFTGFEAGEGYPPGLLDGQAGWSATEGTVIAEGGALQGLQALWMEAGISPNWAAQAFAVDPGESIAFGDLFARPPAGAAAESSVFTSTDTVRIALVASGAEAEFHVQTGNGAGSGVWLATGSKVALSPTGEAAEWVRLSWREDATAGRWDFFVNGRMVAAELGFVGTGESGVMNLTLSGQASVASVFDDFYAGFENPLFVDADRDGMPDAWEIQHGLDPASNDRSADPDGDGLDNVREYLHGTNPLVADTDGDGFPDGWEIAHGQDPLAPDSDGDTDGDGLTNRMEFLLGGDPRRAALPDTADTINLRLYRPRS